MAPVCSPTPIICVTMPGKTSVSFKRVGEVLAGLEGFAYVQESFFNDGIARGLRGNIQSFENGNAGGDQRAKRARETGHGNFAQQDSNQWQLQQDGINACTGRLRAVPDLQCQCSLPTKNTRISNPKMLPTKLLMPMTMRVGSGRSTPKPGEQRRKNRHHFPQQQR